MKSEVCECICIHFITTRMRTLLLKLIVWQTNSPPFMESERSWLCSPLNHVLGRMFLIHIPILFSIFLLSLCRSSNYSLPLRIFGKNLACTSYHAYLSAHLTLLDCIAIIMFGEEFTLWRFSYLFLPLPVSSSLLALNILLSYLFSNTFSLKFFP